MAMWLLICGEIVIFSGGLASYIIYRVRFPELENVTSILNIWLGGINSIILLASSFTAVTAHAAANRKDAGQMSMYTWLTVLLGIVFVSIKGYEWSGKLSHGLTISSGQDWLAILGHGVNYFSYYFFLTGLHLLHVIIGGIALTISMLRVKSSGKNWQWVEMSALYWCFVDIVWIFLFPLLYIVR
jgi:heme/copper-type cytochrome/quinol oxidase subunit 3